jgi:hypothetical protein
MATSVGGCRATNSLPRFAPLPYYRITKLAEIQVSEQTLMAIAGHMSRSTVEHYSYIRMAAKRAALDGIAGQVKTGDIQASVNQNVHQPTNRNSEVPAKPFD